jgi:RNA polymerase sigma factor (TIGR02999 family)
MPMSAAQPEITKLLGLASRGDPLAQAALFRLLEGPLRKLAEDLLRRERPTPDLQTTLLLDDAYLQFVGSQNVTWESRSQFMCYAAKLMRQHIVDYARRRGAAKRGGGQTLIPLDGVPEPVARPALDPTTLVAVHEALGQLAETRPELVQIVELHIYAGWSLKAIAEDILCIPYITVKRRWDRALALLHRALGDGV